MIAQGFGFTRDFLKERNNSAYFRLKKIPCGFKQQARARHPGEKCGLGFDIRFRVIQTGNGGWKTCNELYAAGVNGQENQF